MLSNPWCKLPHYLPAKYVHCFLDPVPGSARHSHIAPKAAIPLSPSEVRLLCFPVPADLRVKMSLLTLITTSRYFLLQPADQASGDSARASPALITCFSTTKQKLMHLAHSHAPPKSCPHPRCFQYLHMDYPVVLWPPSSLSYSCPVTLGPPLSPTPLPHRRACNHKTHNFKLVIIQRSVM